MRNNYWVRYFLVAVAILLLVVISLSLALNREFNKHADDFSETSSELVEQLLNKHIESKGVAIINPLVANLANPVYQMDMDSVYRLLQVVKTTARRVDGGGL